VEICSFLKINLWRRVSVLWWIMWSKNTYREKILSQTMELKRIIIIIIIIIILQIVPWKYKKIIKNLDSINQMMIMNTNCKKILLKSVDSLCKIKNYSKNPNYSRALKEGSIQKKKKKNLKIAKTKTRIAVNSKAMKHYY